MKKDIKKSISVSFKNATLEMVDGQIMVMEKDKDGFVIEETNLADALEFLMGEDGVNLSFKKDNSIEE